MEERERQRLTKMEEKMRKGMMAERERGTDHEGWSHMWRKEKRT